MPLIGYTSPSPASEASTPEIEARLKAIQVKIQAIQDRRNRERGELGTLESGLADVESSAAALGHRLETLKGELESQRAQLKTLKGQKSAKRQTLKRQRAALSRQLWVAYTNGAQSPFKPLFTSKDPSAMIRLATYHDYLKAARLTALTGTQQTLRDLTELETTGTQQAAALERLSEGLAQKQAQLAQLRAQRQTLIAALKAKLKQTDQSLTGLLKDEHLLKDLLVSLDQALVDIPDTHDTDTAFAKLKGRLTWPVNGATQARPSQETSLFIAATPGDPVRVIWHGQVVFADWLRGYGLLLIVDHGDGYMSLYGNNQHLHKTAGERVQRGETIAQVGDSGGQDKSGLYFQLRLNGKALDPHPWLTRTQVQRGN